MTGSAMTSDFLNVGSPEIETTPEPPTPRARGSRRVVRLMVAVLAFAAVAALAMAQGRTSGSHTVDRGGRLATPFTLENLRPGQPQVSLQELQGKPVVLNFWASWCGPCRKEMPAFESVHESLGDKVTFVGIDNKDFRDSALEFVKQTGARYASGFDPRGDVAASYGVIGLPATFFISADGKVLESSTGEMDRDELKEMIRRLYGVA
jgi:cytochrome c biogenesis protein CcmG, thiol:disulfide interchange protein DsbE